MELRRYGRIIWGRGWIILLLVLATALLSINWRGISAPPSYVAHFRISVGLSPEQRGPETYTYDGYYTWLTSEYIVDSFSEVVKSQAFAQDVSERLAEDAGLVIPAGVIQGSTVSEQVHRILTIHIRWGDPGELRQIADAAVRALQEDNAKYFTQLGTSGASVYVIDPPTIVPAGPGWRERLDLPLRILLALLAGIGLVFLLEYLDVTVRDEEELRSLGLPVLGCIPPLPGRRRFPWQRRLP